MAKKASKPRWTLSQEDAEHLIVELKDAVEHYVVMPSPGEQNCEFHVEAQESDDSFVISLFRGKLNTERHMISARIAESGIQLMRLCVNGTPHPNPKNTVPDPGRTHLHIYREGFDDHIAYPVDIESPNFVEDTILLLDKFHVIRKPDFQEGLEGTI